MKRKVILFFISWLNKLGLVLKKDYDDLLKYHQDLIESEAKLSFSLSQMNQVCIDHLCKLKNVQADLEVMTDVQNLLADEVTKLLHELEVSEKRVEVLTNTLIEKKKLDKKRK